MTHILCKGLLVDMDGVLVDSTPAVARVWSRWSQKHNMDPEFVVEFAHGRTSLASIRELLPDVEPAVHVAENQWMERAEIEDVADVIALPGAKELLASVPRNCLTVVTSATRPLAEVRLRVTHLWEYVAGRGANRENTAGDAPLLAAGADWIANDCSSLHLSSSSPPGKLLFEFTDDAHNRRLPQMR